MIVTRVEAKRRGITKYFTGKPCKHGHIVERRASNGLCLKCERLLNASYARVSRIDPVRRSKLNAAVRKCVAKILSDPDRAIAFKEKKSAWERENSLLPEARARKRDLARARYQANPAAGIAKVHKRRAAKLRGGGTYTSDDVEALYEAQTGKCVYCRVDLAGGYHVDHVVALYNGGSNDKRNIQLLCPPCNQSKGSRDPIVFGREYFGLLL